MDPLDKLKLLGPETCYEPAEEVSATGCTAAPARPSKDDLAGCVHHAKLPGGKTIPLLKTMLSSYCERNCTYCSFSSERDFRRVAFSPDELARLFLGLVDKGVCQGVFLSSGLAGGGPNTQERILATAQLLRRRYQFRGYIHLKIMPGAERGQVRQAMLLADRVSVNLEAPNTQRLARLAPRKVFVEELVQRLRWVDEIRREPLPWRWPSSTTQYVVGPAGESDLELLSTTAYLRQHAGIARAYFSSFSPVQGTRLENEPPSSPRREHRLYQASFLLRDYGFEVEDLAFAQDGNLSLETDPKVAWAEENLSETPVEINTADRRDLLRVPGIGPKSADKLLRERARGRLRDLDALSKLGIAAQRAAPFILLDGQAPMRQLSLWAKP